MKWIILKKLRCIKILRKICIRYILLPPKVIEF